MIDNARLILKPSAHHQNVPSRRPRRLYRPRSRTITSRQSPKRADTTDVKFFQESALETPCSRAWISMPTWTQSTPLRAALTTASVRSEEHTSELQSQSNLVCRLL